MEVEEQEYKGILSAVCLGYADIGIDSIILNQHPFCSRWEMR